MDGSLSLADRVLARTQGALAAAAIGLPPSLLRRCAGAPVRRDGLALDPEAQLFLRLHGLTPAPPLSEQSPAQARRRMTRDTLSVRGALPQLAAIRELGIPGAAGPIPARLYEPHGGPPGGLLVYYHGGGFVVGDLDSHEATCRLLARWSGARVLAVDYRLAPEHPFPAAADDAWSAFAYAVHGDELGADPRRVAVGGDSAGGNLAAGVAQRAARDGGPAPALQLLIYPWLDLSRKRRSYELFGEGFYLTEADLDAYAHHYVARATDVTDPRCSPLLARELAGVAPAFIATAGFDPLRDEGEEYAEALLTAGTPAILRRFPGFIHAFIAAAGVSRNSRDALIEIAGATRAMFAALDAPRLATANEHSGVTARLRQ